MLFNSLDFAVFLPIVFILYWFVCNTKLSIQNIFIVVASYIFYAWWDWRFLSLIFFSTAVDYSIGIALSKQQDNFKRKILLWASVAVNLGLLGFFKYYNFFLENFVLAFTLFGADLRYNSLNIILPVGISFYTFQTLSYTIDIYRKQLESTKNFVSFMAFVSFFPQLVAGPIERARDLLPQFEVERKFNFDKAVDGLKQVLWGLFKKMVIADNCAIFVDEFFGNHEVYSGSTLLIGAFFFTIQIYCDFSGYSDIAIGVSRLFGFNLSKNFAFPYFSKNIGEFWRRWHISLTTWYRDYFYIPMGGSRGTKLFQIRNTILIFLVIGLWHGAAWKFIVYGFINALHFLPLIIWGRKKSKNRSVETNKLVPSVRTAFGILKTFTFLVLVRVFFRADDLNIAIGYLGKIFSSSLFSIPEFAQRTNAVAVFLGIIVFMSIEWFGKTNEYAIETLGSNWKRLYRWCFYYVLVFCIFYFYAKPQQFIYFQF
ncbi:membrane bound O-acyl transferase MBOAT family protein [Formosa agariphila KMM 3901]|uniref:Membrane bound O-acyl transferase MBOAT family protein n=1 Tax=Formosa agariphila (strain DSM 15362 / KCTC 12365 / LMG 23005 / KMM 3901 / M-2Alg 35-1) TaxID=1347342 RepID=T2KMV4_FORAG|nr:MBOAT family O-acyltransferase [Formosa agariphila]CDF80237.1 membrane bound O-acyl transferase MBOAT family protein [Formosa agariphila KMM 3901]